MPGVGPAETIPCVLLPVLVILSRTILAIIGKRDATVEWVLGTVLLGALAIGLYVPVAVNVFTWVVR
jgi:hypothetical protein